MFSLCANPVIRSKSRQWLCVCCKFGVFKISFHSKWVKKQQQQKNTQNKTKHHQQDFLIFQLDLISFVCSTNSGFYNWNETLPAYSNNVFEFFLPEVLTKLYFLSKNCHFIEVWLAVGRLLPIFSPWSIICILLKSSWVLCDYTEWAAAKML